MKLLKIKADMHIHSTYSDGKASPLEILYYAKEIGLQAIAITDHNTFKGAVKAREIAKGIPDPPIVVIGNEIRTQYGDVLVYCYEETDLPYTLPELIDKAHEENCLVVPAHPFDILRLGIGEYIYEFNGWDAIEVWNASASKRANKKAIEVSRLLELPGIANSDAHIVDYIGIAYSIIEVNEPDIEELFKSIRKNRVRPHYGYPPFKTFIKRVLWSIEKFIT